MLEGLWRRNRDDHGFSLIEIMVVLLIIGILIAIAVPVFLGARQRAAARSAQSDLRNGLAAAKAYYADRLTYVGFTAAVARTLEPELVWAAVGSPAVGRVAIGGPAPTAVQIQLVARSSYRFFCVKDVVSPAANAGTFYGSGAAYANVDQAAECTRTRW